MKCSRCGDEAAEGQRYCVECRKRYNRQYYVKKKRESRKKRDKRSGKR